MPNTNDPKCKKCRRAGEKLFLKGEKCAAGKCTLVKRSFAPGVHGNKKQAKPTNYGKQLLEKQKAKRIYGLREKQFRNYFEEAFTKVGNTGELLFRILEGRLDSVVYRLGFAESKAKARQMVSHGHIRVNDKKVSFPACQVKIGDVVSIKETSMSMNGFKELPQALAKKEIVAPWVSLNAKEVKGKFTSLPKLGDIAIDIDWRTIVEFYSK